MQEIIYEPRGSALELWKAKDPEVLLDGPAGTGKSRGILEKVNACCIKYPGIRVLLVRKTKASLAETTLVTWEEHVRPPVLPSNVTRASRKSYKYPNGSEVACGGMDDPNKIMSSEYDIIAAFECIEFTEEDWEAFTIRLRNGKMPYNQLLGDTNPSHPGHWLKKRMDRGQTRRIICRHQDNPRLFTDSGQLTDYGQAYMAKLNDLTGIRRARYLLGSWSAAEGLVYEWDDSVHLVDRFEIPEDWRRFRTIDFGFNNPFVCQWWALSPDDELYLYREIYMTKRTVRVHAQQINELSEGERIEETIADHDAEDRATLEESGIYTVAAFKAIRPGIEKVQDRLKVHDQTKRARLYIMRDALVEVDQDLAEKKKPLCTYDEILAYRYPKARGNTEKEVPVKEDDHGMDPMRYLVAHIDGLSDGGIGDVFFGWI